MDDLAIPGSEQGLTWGTGNLELITRLEGSPPGTLIFLLATYREGMPRVRGVKLYPVLQMKTREEEERSKSGTSLLRDMSILSIPFRLLGRSSFVDRRCRKPSTKPADCARRRPCCHTVLVQLRSTICWQ